MVIGVDACCWSNKRGYGRYTRELLRAVVALDRRNEYVLFVDAHTAGMYDLPQRARHIVIHTARPPTEAASAAGRRSLQDVWAMSWRVAQERLDLFFFPSVYTFFPLLRPMKAIVTIHDVIPERFPDLVFPNARARLFWRAKLALARRQVDVILTVSEHAKADIMQCFRIPSARVKVIHEAPDSSFRCLDDRERTAQILGTYGMGVGDRFILYVGGMSPHKNLKTLLEVFADLVRDRDLADIKLVLVGDFQADAFYSHYPSLRALVDRLQLRDCVIFTGFVEDEDLVHLYNAADLLVLPSFDEGFGLPAIEAIACGTPVVASSSTAVPGLVGKAGLFFDPRQPQDLREAMFRVLEDQALRSEMGRMGLVRAQEFSWKRSAADLLALFAQVGGS